MKNFTTSLNDNQLLNKLKNLKKHNDEFTLYTTYEDENGSLDNDDFKHPTFINLEKISNPEHEFQIWVGLTAFPHTAQGHKEIVQYCNY